ncbi:hypothetical protein AAF712_014619 [Marasmius tenuissimus]|uniref:HAT C-terminal dimerisation domain-containing protein n=1 Tax=Marasmius tenuissimus TaxID=585030 RepID=A0ABR2ZAV8_9AGAR
MPQNSPAFSPPTTPLSHSLSEPLLSQTNSTLPSTPTLSQASTPWPATLLGHNFQNDQNNPPPSPSNPTAIRSTAPVEMDSPTRKKRKRGTALYQMSDEDVLNGNFTDEQIIGDSAMLILFSEDLKRLYIGLSFRLQVYLMRRNLPIHIIMDGWTNPQGRSEQGLLVQWYHYGRIFWMILEFIELWKCHEGQYVGGVIANCLKRYTLDKLMALSFFTKQYKKKQVANTSRVEEGDDEDDDLATIVNDDNAAEAEVVSPAVLQSDRAEVKTMKDRAIRDMEAEGVYISEIEKTDAQRILPKVSGFAKCVNESTAVIRPVFDGLVQGMPPNNSDKRTLSRRCPMRWNSEYYCLNDHIYFRSAITSLTNQTGLKLTSYRLTNNQWRLAGQLCSLLKLFIKPTAIFSKKEVSLIADVYETLEGLSSKMLRLSQTLVTPGNESEIVPNVIRVAARGAHLVCRKYLTLMDRCDIYIIAVVMSPNKKLDWFKKHGRTETQVEEIKKLVIQTWNQSYRPACFAPPQSAGPSTSASTATHMYDWNTPVRDIDWDSQWEKEDNESVAADPEGVIDPLLKYLADPPIELGPDYDTIRYWGTRWERDPELTQYGSNYCSAPATSVDAERAFSAGRREVNFMQHNTSHDTFKASMTVGSWVHTPFFSLPDALKALETQIASPSETSQTH